MKTAALILASGLGRRFGGNKLVAPLRGKPLAAYAAQLAMSPLFAERYAVIAAGDAALRAVFQAAGVETIDNAQPEAGQGASLARGVQALADRPIEGVVVLLADMPFVREAHIQKILASAQNADAVMSINGDQLTPPAYFARQHFSALTQLTGDAGARGVFEAADKKTFAPITAHEAMDFDTPEAFTVAERTIESAAG